MRILYNEDVETCLKINKIFPENSHIHKVKQEYNYMQGSFYLSMLACFILTVNK